MISSIKDKTDVGTSQGAAIIGSSVTAIQTALTLAQMGVEVKIITGSAALGWDDAADNMRGDCSPDQRFFWPLMLRAVNHPLITLYSNTEVQSIEGEKGDFSIQVIQYPRYIHENLCTSCGRCQVECSGKITALLDGQKITHGAIHEPVLRAKAVPSAYVIDKNGFAPCHVACPLDINVQGFVSLLANGKVDRALELINEAAPLGGILGRVCRHPCESNCNRAKIDSPVFIRALHRYTADNTTGPIRYVRKFPAGTHQEKIAIVGSGPAGLTAAWELTRRGYSPTIFESHGVIGGMLATGIPRFRLPREVREREIEAIKNMGIDIRTGITVGRDLTFAYLRERGYRAFFLSIGAQRNNKLNIPGEELDGVVDCMSLLLTLNLMVDTFVGSNIVIIGDGNAAIDSARAAIRRNKGTVKILSWTVQEELTASEEEVEEALKEGISIEYRTIPVEILGDGVKVTGIRCQQTRLTEEIMPNGRHRPEPIPGTDFIIDADHVVVAIGQSPDASQLNIEGMSIDSTTGVIKVDPLTLQTSVPAVFAGGDCTTGPNNVVEAMAAGLRAAESIDRYIQKRDLETGRSLEPPQIAEIDIETIEAAPHKRANMPAIRPQKRFNSFEETTTGLSAETAQREAQRCLNCAMCSECMECARICELNAVFHDDSIRHFKVEAHTILRFPSSDLEGNNHAHNAVKENTADGINVVPASSNSELTSELTKAMAIALETAIAIKPKEADETLLHNITESDTDMKHTPKTSIYHPDGIKNIGIFLCRCGGGISSVIDFRALSRRFTGFPGVICVMEIAQACTEEGALKIASEATKRQLDYVVLAACRCCNLEQVCYSCTDRRMLCHQFLKQHLISPHGVNVEFVNIREQCALAHRDDPKGATRKAAQIISSGVNRARMYPPMAPEQKSILPSALIIGGGLVNTTIARALVSRGYQVQLVARQELKQGAQETDETFSLIPEYLQGEDLIVKAWPDVLKLNGSPGNYEAILEYGSQVDCIPVGSVILDTDELNKGTSSLLGTTTNSDLLSRIVSRTSNSGSPYNVDRNLLRETTIKETAGIFLLQSDDIELPGNQVLRGLATAARVSTYLEQASINSRISAVKIDSRLCRSCGNCADICTYIEMKEHGDGTLRASVDKALCLGCGACITSCAAGAITQPLQSDKQIISTLHSVLHQGQILSEV